MQGTRRGSGLSRRARGAAAGAAALRHAFLGGGCCKGRGQLRAGLRARCRGRAGGGEGGLERPAERALPLAPCSGRARHRCRGIGGPRQGRGRGGRPRALRRPLALHCCCPGWRGCRTPCRRRPAAQLLGCRRRRRRAACGLSSGSSSGARGRQAQQGIQHLCCCGPLLGILIHARLLQRRHLCGALLRHRQRRQLPPLGRRACRVGRKGRREHEGRLGHAVRRNSRRRHPTADRLCSHASHRSGSPEHSSHSRMPRL